MSAGFLDRTDAPAAAPAPTEPSTRLAWRRRRGEAWRVVASGSTEAEASDRLHELMSREQTGHAATFVLRAGQKP